MSENIPQPAADSHLASAQPSHVAPLVASQQVVKIPLALLLPNENQPRRRFRSGSIQQMAESLKALGQQTPLKVRPLTAQEKASYLKSEIESHKYGDPLPEKTLGERGFEYLVIGGHRRLEGAKLAGFETLDCIVLDMKPEDTHLASVMDNNQEDMDWWDWDLAIEAEHKAFPNLTQRELADRLGVSKTKVNTALILTKALTEGSRSTIDLNLDTPPYPPQPDAKDPEEEDDFVRTPDKTAPDGNLVRSPDKTKPYYRITEYVLLALLKLDPDEIDEILELVIVNKMNPVVAERFAQWILDGNETMKFDTSAHNGKTKEPDPLAEAWKTLGPQIKVKYKGGENYEIHLSVTGGQKALETAQAVQKALQGGLAKRLLGIG